MNQINMHELKTWPKHFEAIFDGRKKFELRYNDRGFKVGDFLYLREWQPNIVWANPSVFTHSQDGEYTGREIRAVITYLLDTNEEQPEFVPDDWVILSIHRISRSLDGNYWEFTGG